MISSRIQVYITVMAGNRWSVGGHAGVAGAALCGAGLLLAPVQLERQTKGAGECLTEKRSNIWLNISNCGT